jgi:hypothetical protein
MLIAIPLVCAATWAGRATFEHWSAVHFTRLPLSNPSWKGAYWHFSSGFDKSFYVRVSWHREPSKRISVMQHHRATIDVDPNESSLGFAVE